MVDSYAYLACEVRTGYVVSELPLVNVSWQRHVNHRGQLSADVPMTLPDMPGSSEAARFEAVQPVLRQIIDSTDPGLYSIVVVRNGLVMGEWIIWGRARESGGRVIHLQALEFGSILDHRIQPARTFTQVEQLSIANSLASAGFSAAQVTVTIAAYTASGQLRDRVYENDAGTVGQRLDELANVIDGFDWTIDSSWAPAASGRQAVVRTFRTAYPRLGIDQPIILDASEIGAPGGAVLQFALAEDATKLASDVFAYGGDVDTGGVSVKLIGHATSTALTALGYPALQRTTSRSSVIQQATIDEAAKAFLAICQFDEDPPTLVLEANGYPALGDYQLGDRVTIVLAPVPEWPDGKTLGVRILGWTVQPPVSGTETVALEVTSMTDAPGDDTGSYQIGVW